MTPSLSRGNVLSKIDYSYLSNTIEIYPLNVSIESVYV